MRVSERSPKDGEILTEYVYQAAMDRTVSGYNAISIWSLFLKSEHRRLVTDEHPQLLKRPFVQKNIDALASR